MLVLALACPYARQWRRALQAVLWVQYGQVIHPLAIHKAQKRAAERERQRARMLLQEQPAAVDLAAGPSIFRQLLDSVPESPAEHAGPAADPAVRAGAVARKARPQAKAKPKVVLLARRRAFCILCRLWLSKHGSCTSSCPPPPPRAPHRAGPSSISLPPLPNPPPPVLAPPCPSPCPSGSHIPSPPRPPLPVRLPAPSPLTLPVQHVLARV
jgi:hypothetical protein